MHTFDLMAAMADLSTPKPNLRFQQLLAELLAEHAPSLNGTLGDMFGTFSWSFRTGKSNYWSSKKRNCKSKSSHWTWLAAGRQEDMMDFDGFRQLYIHCIHILWLIMIINYDHTGMLHTGLVGECILWVVLRATCTAHCIDKMWQGSLRFCALLQWQERELPYESIELCSEDVGQYTCSVHSGMALCNLYTWQEPFMENPLREAGVALLAETLRHLDVSQEANLNTLPGPPTVTIESLPHQTETFLELIWTRDGGLLHVTMKMWPCTLWLHSYFIYLYMLLWCGTFGHIVQYQLIALISVDILWSEWRFQDVWAIFSTVLTTFCNQPWFRCTER